MLFTVQVPDNERNFTFPKTVIGMTLNSALEDLRATTLKAISGTLRKLQYLAGLRDSSGTYTHWGLARVHGELAAAKAIAEEHRSLVSTVLATPIEGLIADVKQCSELAGLPPQEFVKQLAHGPDLLPPEPGAGAAGHLSSVLHALSSLLSSNLAGSSPTKR